MPSPDEAKPPLRERKRQRARAAIVAAAVELFTERGFDEVTVTDIAERAEVGRTTFFRYFGDKQEVLFSDDGSAVAATADAVGPPPAPIGTDLSAALTHVRALVTTFVERLTDDEAGYTLHQRLVAQHPELYARSVVKQRSYAASLTAQLRSHGADPRTASLAAELGLACYYAAQQAAGDDPKHLPGAVADAFDRITPPP